MVTSHASPQQHLGRSCATAPERTLGRWPLLRAVQYSQHLHLVSVDLVNGDEGKRGEYELTGALDATGTAAVRERVKRVNASNYVQGDSPGGFGPVLSNVIDDSLKVVSGLVSPPNAHQAR